MNFLARLFLVALWLVLTCGISNAAESSDLVILARVSERLIVAVSGAFSLWLGYRLFDSVGQKQRKVIESAGVLASQEASAASDTNSRRSMLEAKLGEVLNIKMSDVGPGIFFALFGSVILGYVMYSSVSLSVAANQPKVDEASQQSAAKSDFIKFANPQLSIKLGDREKLLEFVRAVRILETYRLTADTGEAGKEKVAEALRTLSSSKGALIDYAFGQGSFAKYQLLKVKAPEEFKRETKEAQEQFYSIDGSMIGGL